MRVRRMDFKERKHLDKRVLRAFVVAVVFIACVSLIGIMVANSTVTLARTGGAIDAPPTGGKFTKDGLTIYDRIRYWEGGERGPIEKDRESGEIKYWQAIPAEYSAGRIISENPYTLTEDRNIGKEAYCPVENFQYSYSKNGDIKYSSWMRNNFDKVKAFCGYKGGLSGIKSSKIGEWSNESELVVQQTKDPRAWIDYYDGAAYEDKFYDMRIYGWSSRQAAMMAYEGYGPSMAAVDFIVPIYATSMYEFHFYPSGTLKKLNEKDNKPILYKGPKPSPSNMKAEGKDAWQQGYDLYYNLAYRQKYMTECSGDNCDVCLKTPNYSWRLLEGRYPSSYTNQIKCYTDNAAYRDESGNIVYTGVYGHYEEGYSAEADAKHWGAWSYKNADHFIVDYTAKEYEEYLKTQEKSINPLNPDKDDPAAAATQGVFKGSIRIHQWLTTGPFISIMGGGTVEQNADGTTSKVYDVNVYTEYDKDFYISNPWDKMFFGKNYRQSKKNDYCPPNADDSAPLAICNYRWSTINRNPDYDPYHNGSGARPDMWITFTSSYENPFTYAWDWGNCAHADVGEDTYTVAYVFDGDVESLPDDYPEIYKQMKEFNEEYERVYKQPLSADPFFKTTGQNIDPRLVYKLFRVATYSDYDPYSVNKSFPEDSGIEKEEFEWYNCDAMEDDCLIPNDNPDHNSGNQQRNGRTYYNGYDFIDGDRVYYGCLECSLATYFPNTCYSKNNEPDAVKDLIDNTKEHGIGEESERQGN